MEQYMMYCAFPVLDHWHKTLIDEVSEKFCVPQTRERGFKPHFTLKYRFEAKKPQDLDSLLEDFSKNRNAAPLQIKGVNYFSHGTVYLEVNLLPDAMKMRSELMDKLHGIEWIEWRTNNDEKETDGVYITPHLTVAEGCTKEVANIIMKHLDEKSICYNLNFDNITILRRFTDMDSKKPSKSSEYDVLKVYKLAEH
jgi:2'-5' RNA ligase